MERRKNNNLFWTNDIFIWFAHFGKWLQSVMTMNGGNANMIICIGINDRGRGCLLIRIGLSSRAESSNALFLFLKNIRRLQAAYSLSTCRLSDYSSQVYVTWGYPMMNFSSCFRKFRISWHQVFDRYESWIWICFPWFPS